MAGGDAHFYRPAEGTGLPHDPFNAIVGPRPIGWISTLDAAGRPNLAPYSYCNMIHNSPPMLAFGSEGLKHSAANARASGEFVFNLATRPLFEAMNASSDSLPEGVSEFEAAGIATAPSRLVRPPRVAEAYCALECKLLRIVALDNLDGVPVDRHVAFGQVVGVHIDERFIRNGRLDTAAMQPIARCGYDEYTVVERVFSMDRPPSGGDAFGNSAR